MLERVKSLKDLVVLNDEAHHVHDEDLAWSQSLLAIHRALPKGLALWLDFSATPKDQNGMYFPWTVCDYPLAQAVEDRIVKAPLIVTKEDDPKQPKQDPENVTKDNVAREVRLLAAGGGAALEGALQASTRSSARKPVLFIMAEKNVYADALGEYLWKTKEFGFKESEVLVIHTDAAGEITKKDLEKAREAARDIDKAESKIKAIVSVMMLREGWDVRNVTVVLGLRPFTAKAEILPEQVIGRGLRLMTQVSPDRTQTLEVLGTRNLLNVLRDPARSRRRRRRQHQDRSADAGHHRAGPGAARLRHRDPDHQAEPGARHPQALRARRRGARSRSTSRRSWPSVPGQAEA